MSLIKRLLNSRKFWAFLVGLVTLLSSAMADGIISTQEGNQIAALVIGYIFSIAFEDGLSNINPPKTE